MDHFSHLFSLVNILNYYLYYYMTSFGLYPLQDIRYYIQNNIKFQRSDVLPLSG